MSTNTSNEVFTRSILYGSTATAIKKPENDFTHRWKVYVRGFNNEDISDYVKKVQFRLHESFLQPNRVVDKFPFEVEEVGWGEFQIQIKVYFHDAPDRPLTLFHNLRLYAAGEDLEAQIANNCPPVIFEQYEEVVFDPPPPALLPVMKTKQALHDITKSPKYPELLAKEKEEIERMDRVLQSIESEISLLQSK